MRLYPFDNDSEALDFTIPSFVSDTAQSNTIKLMDEDFDAFHELDLVDHEGHFNHLYAVSYCD